jgi:iron-sulfur cluster assembly protein
MTTATTDRPPARPRPAPITLTDGAHRRIADLIARAPGPVAGVRLSTPKRGCSGLAYSIDYAETPKPGDEAIATPAGTLFVDGGSLLYLIGSVMDWQEDDFSAGFVFQNPNAKGSCGCGESFTV